MDEVQKREKQRREGGIAEKPVSLPCTQKGQDRPPGATLDQIVVKPSRDQSAVSP